MKKAFLWLASVMLSAALVMSCIKTTEKCLSTRQSEKKFMAYGPIEEYGARADHEKLGMVYAPGEPDAKYLTADVYWNDHEGRAPLIVNIHGGGWLLADKNSLSEVYRCKYLANRGYVVVNVNYRMLPKYPIQSQVNDVMGAVIWAKEHAEEFGADPEKVGVMGSSAGGHLGAMVAWASDDATFVPTGHAASSYHSDVSAAVLFYGVYDLEKTLNRDQNGLTELSFPFFTKMGKGQKRDELMKHISPKYHVKPTLPPTFFICGNQDRMGLYDDAVTFKQKLEQNNVPTGLYTAEGADHGFDTNYGEAYTQGAYEAMAAWFDQYLKTK